MKERKCKRCKQLKPQNQFENVKPNPLAHWRNYRQICIDCQLMPEDKVKALKAEYAKHYASITRPPAPTTKRCPRCKIIKARKEFEFAGKTQMICQPCSQIPTTELKILKIRRQKISRFKELTEEKYLQLLEESGSRCQACLVLLPESQLCIDHDHDTNEIRGLLCSNCNTAIGHLKDSSERAQQVVIYLKDRGY